MEREVVVPLDLRHGSHRLQDGSAEMAEISPTQTFTLSRNCPACNYIRGFRDAQKNEVSLKINEVPSTLREKLIAMASTREGYLIVKEAAVSFTKAGLYPNREASYNIIFSTISKYKEFIKVRPGVFKLKVSEDQRKLA